MKEPVQLCYSISEAAKLMANVEPHVLRYWEDELLPNITRNPWDTAYIQTTT